MRWNRVFFALGLFMLLASSANAGLIISVQSPSIGTAKVMITSNSSDDLGQFTAVFDITSNASNAVVPVTSLEFVSPAAYLTDPTLNAGNYVYNGVSFAYDTATVFGVASDPVGSGYNTEFAGADIYDGSAVSGAVTIANGTSYLLANLVFQYSAPGTTNAAGDVFNITLNRASSSFYDGSGNALTVVGYDPILAIGTVSSSGTISVVPIPEPSSLLMSLTAIIGGCIHWSRQRRST